MNKKQLSLKNFTNLDDKEAADVLSSMRMLLSRGEDTRKQYLDNAEKAFSAWRGELWTKDDLAFFKRFDITPYVFRDFRPLINNLIHRQRARRFKMELVPRDIHSYRRFKAGKEAFITEHIDEFATVEEAEKFYDEYADDEYAQAISSMVTVIRDENKAKYIESEWFENGLITGLDVMKCIYSYKNNREGSIELARKSMRQMVWDDQSMSYTWDDVEFIGEVHKLYKSQLQQLYPDFKEEIETHFEQFTNVNKARNHVQREAYKEFYQFEDNNDRVKAKIAEMYTLSNEDRYKITDKQTGDKRLIRENVSEEELMDKLKEMLLQQLFDEAKASGDPDALIALGSNPNLEAEVSEGVQERFEVETCIEPIWYKTVFTYDVLFEHKQVDYPHDSHPYYPFFPQFTDGYFTSVMQDVMDVIIAMNKALMFREMIMAHGSKGLLVVNQDVMTQSNLDVNEIAEAYTQVGGVLVMKLKPGQRMAEALDIKTDIGKGLAEINALIQDYDYRLQHIIGVNRAQMGQSSSDAPASRFRMEIAEGESNNGLLYDNFVRSVEGFYNDKVVPLVVEYMRSRPNTIVRVLGDGVKPWLSYEIDEKFDLFSEAIRNGEFTLTVVPTDEDSQINASNSAQLMQMATVGLIPLETAFEYSNMPDRYKIIKSIKQHRQKQAIEQAATQVDMQMVQQMMMENGVSQEQAEIIMKNLHKQRNQEILAERNQQTQQAQGMAEVQRQASESSRIGELTNQ
jgi:hypothetical protein